MKTWLFGYKILHHHVSDIHNKFMFNFPCRKTKKESELYLSYVYDLGYSVLNDLRTITSDKYKKWAWIEEIQRLVGKSSAKFPVVITSIAS